MFKELVIVYYKIQNHKQLIITKLWYLFKIETSELEFSRRRVNYYLRGAILSNQKSLI